MASRIQGLDWSDGEGGLIMPLKPGQLFGEADYPSGLVRVFPPGDFFCFVLLDKNPGSHRCFMVQRDKGTAMSEKPVPKEEFAQLFIEHATRFCEKSEDQRKVQATFVSRDTDEARAFIANLTPHIKNWEFKCALIPHPDFFVRVSADTKENEIRVQMKPPEAPTADRFKLK